MLKTVKPKIKQVKNIKLLSTSEEKIVCEIFALTKNDFNAHNLQTWLNSLVNQTTKYNSLSFQVRSLLSIGYAGGEFTLDNQTFILLDDLSLLNNFKLKQAQFAITFLHEFRHANQEEFVKTSKQTLFRAMKFEDNKTVFPQYEYSLHEIDARFYSIKKFYSLMQKQKIDNCIETNYVLLKESFTLLANFSGLLNSELLKNENTLSPRASLVALEVLKYLNKVDENNNIDIYKLEQNFFAITQKVNEIYNNAYSDFKQQLLSNKDMLNYYKALSLNRRVENAKYSISSMFQMLNLMEAIAFNKSYFRTEYADCNHIPENAKNEYNF